MVANKNDFVNYNIRRIGAGAQRSQVLSKSTSAGASAGARSTLNLVDFSVCVNDMIMQNIDCIL